MLTKFVANGTRFRRKTAPEMSFFPFRSAYTRSTEKPGVGLSEQGPLTRADSKVVPTCKAKELDERKGIGHILVDLAAAEHVMSNGLLTERIQRHAPLSCNGKISACRKYRLSAKCVP